MQCPKCNMNLKDDAKFCMYCGYQLENNQTQLAESEVEISHKKKAGIKSIIQIIIAALNMILIIPSVGIFFVVWMIFGSFSGNATMYYGLLLFCPIYFIFSIIFLIRSISNMDKSSK